MNSPLLTFPIALLFAAVHVFSGRLAFLDVTPRSWWLSFAGGVSVAYVFVHLMPELAERQADVADSADVLRLEAEIFLIALLGLTAFYGLERFARGAARAAKRDQRAASVRVFWLHIASFAAYNALIGYLLVHRDDLDLSGLAFYAVALGLHFVVNDRGLHEHHGDLYASAGRWVLAAAVLVGWALGIVTEIDDAWVAGLFAFLVGGIILNVLKEELPEERESHFLAFVVGAAGYAALFMLV